MKKVKTILFSVAVVLVSLFLCSAGCQNAADSGGGGGQPGAAYSFDENSKTLTIHHDKYLYSIPYSIRDVVVKAVIENGVTSINFADCKKLESVSIPSSVTYIGRATFSNCESLRSVSIPNGVTEIVPDMFSGCKKLESVSIPDSVTKIYSYAFYGCESLRSVSIPRSVTEINYHGTFVFCKNLTSVTIEATTPPTLFRDNSSSASNNTMFGGTSDSLNIYVPASSVEAYKNNSQLDYGDEVGWSLYAGKIFPIQ